MCLLHNISDDWLADALRHPRHQAPGTRLGDCFKGIWDLFQPDVVRHTDPELTAMKRDVSTLRSPETGGTTDRSVQGRLTSPVFLLYSHTVTISPVVWGFSHTKQSSLMPAGCPTM